MLYLTLAARRLLMNSSLCFRQLLFLAAGCCCNLICYNVPSVWSRRTLSRVSTHYTPWPAPWPGCLGTGPPRSPQPGPAVCRGLARGFFHLQNCNSRSVHRIRIKTETQFCNVILCFVLNVHLDHVVRFPLVGPGLGADVGVDLDPLLGEAPAAHPALRQPGLRREGGLGLGLGRGPAASCTLHLHPRSPR